MEVPSSSTTVDLQLDVVVSVHYMDEIENGPSIKFELIK
jgi:hypothetical protein